MWKSVKIYNVKRIKILNAYEQANAKIVQITHNKNTSHQLLINHVICVYYFISIKDHEICKLSTETMSTNKKIHLVMELQFSTYL